jgi:hypothetical protein
MPACAGIAARSSPCLASVPEVSATAAGRGGSWTLLSHLMTEFEQLPLDSLVGTVKLILIMIYFANTNTKCGSHVRRTVTYFVIALAK